MIIRVTLAVGTGRLEPMTLPLTDFIQRVLLHVPVPRTQVVRFYGLYHHTQVASLAVCRAHLGQPPVEMLARLDWQAYCARRGDDHPERCPSCGQQLVFSAIIPRGGAPPARPSGERAA